MQYNISNKDRQYLKELLRKFIDQDSSILIDEGYLIEDDIINALYPILNNEKLTKSQKLSYLKEPWRFWYRLKPPTVEEFLTPEWIGVIADKIYPQVVETFKQFMQPWNRKRVLALSTAIGWGKTSLSTLIVVYIIVHLHYMINPKQWFNLNEIGSIVIALMSFTQKKVNQLLLQPFYTLLKTSPMFERVKREDRLDIKQKEIGNRKIAYTSAGRMGAIQFSRDLHITIASNRGDLLGLNIIMGIVSEISFWIEEGIAIEEIWGAFSDMRERVNSRFAHRYLSGVILDSSPYDLGLSPIDKWIYEGEAQTDPEVLIVNATQWDVFPEKYPKWLRTGETIPVFRGDAGKPPKIVREFEKEQYASKEIIEFPIDVEQSLKNPGELKKIVADLAGWPAGGLSKLVDDVRIVNNIFTDKLNNVYTSINAPDTRDPEKLIWNKVRDTFFIKVGKRYEFYRAPNAKRALHLDLAESGDMASIGMSHLEMNKETGNNIVVNDFIIVVSPEKDKINLDAVCSFIIDLKKLGNIKFYKITADQYQSSAILQRLKRYNIDVDRLSVDRETAPYRIVISWIFNEKVKVGKNIFLKNNLLSLIEIQTDKGKTKIDHTKGQIIYEDGADWSKSLMGANAKDASDSFVGSAYTLISDLENTTQQYIWTEEKETENYRDGEGHIDTSILEEINKKFSLTTSDVV